MHCAQLPTIAMTSLNSFYHIGIYVRSLYCHISYFFPTRSIYKVSTVFPQVQQNGIVVQSIRVYVVARLGDYFTSATR